VFVADISKVKRLVGWEAGIDKDSGVRMMLDWLVANFDFGKNH